MVRPYCYYNILGLHCLNFHFWRKLVVCVFLQAIKFVSNADENSMHNRTWLFPPTVVSKLLFLQHFP